MFDEAIFRGILVFAAAALVLLYATQRSLEKNTPSWMTWVSLSGYAVSIIAALQLGISIGKWISSFYPEYEILIRSIVGLAVTLGLLGLLSTATNITSSKSRTAYSKKRYGKLLENRAIFYSVNSEGELTEHNTVPKEEALQHTEDNLRAAFSGLRNPDESTHFGFDRDIDHFIEVSAISEDWGSYIWYECPKLNSFLFWQYQTSLRFEIRKASAQKVMRCVEAFFSYDSERCLSFLKQEGAKRDS